LRKIDLMPILRILIDGRTIKNNPSGLGIWNLQLVRHLVKYENIQLFLILTKNCDYDFSNDGLLSPFLKEKLILINSNHDYKFVSLDRFVFEQFQLPKIIQRLKIDLYHATDSFGIPINLPKKIKVMLTIHDLIPLTPYREYLNWQQFLIYRVSLFLSIKRANLITAISDKTKTDIKHYLQPKTNVVAVYDGVDEPTLYSEKIIDKAFVQLNQQYLLKKQQYLLYYGGFGPRRNTETLIKVLRQLIDQQIVSPDFKLVLSGRIKNAKTQALLILNGLKNLIKNLKLQDNVVIIDYLMPESKAALIKNSSLFVTLTLYEGFGLTPMEVIKYNKYALTTRTGIWHQFPSLNNIFIIEDPFSIPEISHKVSLIIQNSSNLKADYQKMVNFTKVFQWSSMAKNYFKLYGKIIKTI